MATQAKRNKATSPSRNKAGGGGAKKAAASKGAKAKRAAKPKEAKVAVTPTEDTPTDRGGLPARAERQGTRRIHSRELTPKQAKARQERDEKRRADEVAAQKKHRDGLKKKGKGWGGARARRGAVPKGAPRGR